MLKKKPVAQAAQTAKTPKAPKPASAGVPSLISADVEIEGNLTSRGEVQFDGAIVGDLRADGLVIGEGASVRGEVIADRVRVCGRVEGVIRALRVDLASTAVVEGDVLHAALTVEDGARLDGKMCCMENPLGQARGAAEHDKETTPGLDTAKVAKELAEQPALRAAADAPASRKAA